MRRAAVSWLRATAGAPADVERWLFGLNQLIVSAPTLTTETGSSAYLLRILGFTVILVSIIDKNRARPQR